MPAIFARVTTALRNAMSSGIADATSSKPGGTYLKFTKVSNSFRKPGYYSVERVRVNHGQKEVTYFGLVLPYHKEALQNRLEHPEMPVSMIHRKFIKKESSDEFHRSEQTYRKVLNSLCPRNQAIPPCLPVRESSLVAVEPAGTTGITRLPPGSAYDEPDSASSSPAGGRENQLHNQSLSDSHNIHMATVLPYRKPKLTNSVPLRLQLGTLVVTMIDAAISKNKLDASQRQDAINVVGIVMDELQKVGQYGQKAAIGGHIATRLARAVDHCCQQPENTLGMSLLKKKEIGALTDSISKDALGKNGLLDFFSSSTRTPVSEHNADPLEGIIKTATGTQAQRFINDEIFIACCANTVACSLLSVFMQDADSLSLSEKVDKTIHEVRDSMNDRLITDINQFNISQETAV